MFGKLFVDDEEVPSYVQGNDPASPTALHGIKINQIFTFKFFQCDNLFKSIEGISKSKTTVEESISLFETPTQS